MLSELIVTSAVLTVLCLGDIQVSIDEELSPGTEVTRLPSHPSIYGNLSEDQIQSLTYAILSQNSPPASYFRIDSKTGIVSVTSRMDRENICDPIEKCSVTISIAIQSGGQSQVPFSTVVTLDIVINDINDNPPRFPARDVTLEIPEGAKVGSEMKISGAVDRDSRPELTVQHYNITPAMSTFSLRPTINLDGSSTVNLRLERELDRETNDEYTFNIMAFDGGSNPQSDYLSVTVRVTDDNDNIPSFSQSRYEMTVNTNEKIGGKIGQVKATDEDLGEFGRITYSFSSNSESAIKGIFAINSSSGWITLNTDLRTIRRTSPFLMFVDARDNGEPPLSSQALVSLLIVNSENNAPYVKVNTIAAGDVSSLSIPESAALDHFVAFVDVDDKDDGDNGKVTCHILKGSEFKLSPVISKGYTLLLNAEVDREKRDYYQIVIICKDGGTPSLETRVTLTVNVTDINDNTPKFTTNLYTGSIDENRDPGQFITQVTAHDADLAANAEISYSLAKEALEYIRIHPRTGVISTSAALDREKNATLRFKVFASDRGETQRTGVAEISISIRDVNDNTPLFTTSKFVFSISEHTSNSSIVGHFEAFDLDSGSNGQFDFYFGGSTTGEVPLPFAVLKNGSILVAGLLDRETKGSYSFTALVRDRGEVPLSSSASVEIKLLDENDNDPVILFPTSRNDTIIISSLPENGMVLGRIIAYDMDEAGTGNLRYFIYEGNVDGAFSMGLTSGELMIHNVHRLQNSREYFLSIKVEDASINPRNTTTQLRVEARFDNKTASDILQQSEAARDQYIIIVGVIGGATIVLSVFIISAIILILRSERNRRDASNVSSVKNKFFDGATLHNAATPKNVESLDGSKFQSSSSMRSEVHDVASGHTTLGKKNDDVQKKVSFSLQDEPHNQGQAKLSEKHLRLNFPPAADVNVPLKIFNSPDDVSSDTSGESGTYDSGRGTSDEDIKFDYLLNRGPSRMGEPFLSFRDRSFDQPSNQFNTRPVANIHGQSNRRLHTPTLPLKPEQPPRFLESNPGCHDTRNSYHGQRQFPLSSFAPGVTSSMRHPNHLRAYNLCKEDTTNEDLMRPASSLAYKQQNSFVSMDDDVSTTTSGSYVINPDAVRLETFLNTDIVV